MSKMEGPTWKQLKGKIDEALRARGLEDAPIYYIDIGAVKYNVDPEIRIDENGLTVTGY